jgi:glucose-1-phosphatase
MIKSIIFDLGKVIVPFDFQRSFSMMQKLSPHGPDEMRRRLFANDLIVRYETGLVESRAFVTEVCQMLDMKAEYADFQEFWCSIFLPETLIPESMVRSLRERYRVLLLSNTNEMHYEMLERTYPILRHFDEHILSHRVGAAKPSPKIYQEAIRAAGCAPKECFFTDDLDENIEAARREGIDAVRFENLEQLVRELQLRGVVWDRSTEPGSPDAASGKTGSASFLAGPEGHC